MQHRVVWGIAALVLALAAHALAGCTERSDAPSDPDSAVSMDGGALDASGLDAGAACARDLDCADRIACSIDHCVAGSCQHDPCPDCCAGGLVCNASLGCVGAPEPCTVDADCRDTVRCTLDACRDATECEHAPQDSLCADGEICLPAVGCIPAPPTSCTTAADCEVGARCVGEWDCQDEFGCVFVSAVDCDDADACTVDSCVEEMGGCVHELRDDDGDTHPALSCSGDDCADDDATRYPGATEACGDSIDQDCDSMIDEGCCSVGACTTSCGSTGTVACPTGECVAPAETCNGADDDCDGSVDDGFECTGAETRACTTACGTSGVQTCAGCAFGACAPPAEVCNGADDDCDGALDDAFACARGSSQACATSCGSSGTQACATDCSGYGACVAPAESCNGTDDDCDGTADDGFACRAGSTSTCPTACGSTGTRTCTGACAWDLCAPPAETCNGVDDDCDGARDDGFGCFRGETRDCTALGFYAGTAVCRNDCSSFDTSTCTNCGNGVRQGGEACDGVDLGGATCTSIGMGFGGGTLRCGAGCMLDTSMCTRCGNGTIDAGEQCDGTNLGSATCASLGMGFDSGTLRCTSGCAYDTSMCAAFTPTGSYAVSPAPSYTCAFGLVSFSGGTMSLSLAGSTMTLTMAGLPCSPSGIYNPTTRSFDLTCTAPGTCAETYRLVGSFTGANTWSGTFSATYVGGAGACYDCGNQSWSVTGTR